MCCLSILLVEGKKVVLTLSHDFETSGSELLTLIILCSLLNSTLHAGVCWCDHWNNGP